MGGHVASLPERTLREEDADFVCASEGPQTVVELVEALRTGRSDEHAKVRGLWYYDGENVMATSPAPLVTSPEQEMPEWRGTCCLWTMYRAHNWHCFGDLEREPYAALYTTLGCPYHCTFCCIQAPFKSGEKALSIKEQVTTHRIPLTEIYGSIRHEGKETILW